MSHTLSIGDVEIEYRWIRRGLPGIPIVFLHEGLGSVTHWKDFPDTLCARVARAGLAFSRVGYGASSPVTLPRRLDYFWHEGEEMLPAILDATGIERAILFGHSDGASIALVAAAALGPRVAALIVISAHVFTEPAGLAAIHDAVGAYESGDLRDRLARHHGDVDGAFHGWAGAWLDPAFLQPDLTHVLGAITSPTLILQGTADPYGTVAQSEAIAVHAGGPVKRVDLVGLGHSPHRDGPETVIAETARFLDRHIGPSSGG